MGFKIENLKSLKREVQKLVLKQKKAKSKQLDYIEAALCDLYDLEDPSSVCCQIILAVVEESKVKGYISGSINNTFISLIPRNKSPIYFK